MWPSFATVVLVSLALCAPALADTVTGGAAMPDPATDHRLAATGGAAAGGAGRASEPGSPPRSPQARGSVPLQQQATTSRRLQQDEPLQDLPQGAPEAPEEPGAREAPEPAQEEAGGPGLAATGLDAVLLAYLGAAMVTIGLAAFAVLRKRRRVLEGRRG